MDLGKREEGPGSGASGELAKVAAAVEREELGVLVAEAVGAGKASVVGLLKAPKWPPPPLAEPGVGGEEEAVGEGEAAAAADGGAGGLRRPALGPEAGEAAEPAVASLRLSPAPPLSQLRHRAPSSATPPAMLPSQVHLCIQLGESKGESRAK